MNSFDLIADTTGLRAETDRVSTQILYHDLMENLRL